MSKEGTGKRPNVHTMEGMIWNANHVLDTALDAKTNPICGIPRGLVKKCKGVVLLTAIEAGLVISGNSGSGVIIAQNDKGEWSAPSAIGLKGMGLGYLIGYASKDIVILLMDDDLVKKAGSGSVKIPKLTGQSGFTAGEVSRCDDLDTFREGQKGAWGFMYSKGVMGSLALETINLSEHKKQNAKFYGKDKVSAAEILFENAVEIPEGSGIPDLHRKLELLKGGKTLQPTPAEEEKKESLRAQAEEAGESIKEELEEGELEEIDNTKEAEAEKEAEKEAEPGKEAEAEKEPAAASEPEATKEPEISIEPEPAKEPEAPDAPKEPATKES